MSLKTLQDQFLSVMFMCQLLTKLRVVTGSGGVSS